MFNFHRITLDANRDNNRSSSENFSSKEKDNIHQAYSEMGKKGGKIGGEKRAQQLGHDGYVEMGKKGGEARKEQMAKEGTFTHKEDNK